MNANSKIKLNLDSLKARRDWKRHKVKDGHNVFRILPPFGEASNGYPYRKWQIIWGLNDPETGRVRPFASSMTSEKKCPITEYVDILKNKAKTLESTLEQAGESSDNIEERLALLNKLISDISPKTIYVYNAVDQAGEVGLLELKSTAQKKMKSEMNQYVNDYNQDPTSLNSNPDDSGVWFDVIREGEGFKTTYDVKKRQVKVKNPTTGKVSFDDDQSPLPDSVVENYDNLAYDLTAIYQVKTYEDLNEILLSNLSRLVDLCPDANLDAPVAIGSTLAAKSPTKAVAKSAGKIAIKLDDEDDLEVDEVVVTRTTSQNRAIKQSVSSNDDFMNEADAILNG